jgi:uncharacterized protein (TIGR02246 family)
LFALKKGSSEIEKSHIVTLLRIVKVMLTRLAFAAFVLLIGLTLELTQWCGWWQAQAAPTPKKGLGVEDLCQSYSLIPWTQKGNSSGTSLAIRNTSIAQAFSAQEISAMADHHPLNQAAFTKSDYRSVIETAREAWLDGDGKTFSELFIPSGKMIVPGQQWIGRNAIQDAIQDYHQSYSAISIDIKSILIDGDRAAIEWAWHDVERQTEHHSQADDAIIVTFQDGLIAEWREYIDSKTPDA